jgi:CheY-like chemotaxis protein
MQRCVVVVDDDADVRGAIVEILEGEGLEAFGVAEGQEALDYIRQQSGRVGLVLLDARMPGLDGESFLRIRVHDPAVRDTPVIVFTADRDLEPVISIFSADQLSTQALRTQGTAAGGPAETGSARVTGWWPSTGRT